MTSNPWSSRHHNSPLDLLLKNNESLRIIYREIINFLYYNKKVSVISYIHAMRLWVNDLPRARGTWDGERQTLRQCTMYTHESCMPMHYKFDNSSNVMHIKGCSTADLRHEVSTAKKTVRFKNKHKQTWWSQRPFHCWITWMKTLQNV